MWLNGQAVHNPFGTNFRENPKISSHHRPTRADVVLEEIMNWIFIANTKFRVNACWADCLRQSQLLSIFRINLVLDYILPQSPLEFSISNFLYDFPNSQWNFSLDFISVGRERERNCAKMIRSIYKSDYRDPQQIMRDDELKSNLRHKKSIYVSKFSVARTSSEVEVSSLMKEQKQRKEVRRHCLSEKMSGRCQEDNNDSMRWMTPLSGTHCPHGLTTPPQSEATASVSKSKTSSSSQLIAYCQSKGRRFKWRMLWASDVSVSIHQSIFAASTAATINQLNEKPHRVSGRNLQNWFAYYPTPYPRSFKMLPKMWTSASRAHQTNAKINSTKGPGN